MTQFESETLKTLSEISSRMATVEEKVSERSRASEMLSRWLMWAAGVVVALGLGGINGVTNNHTKNIEQDHEIKDIKAHLRMKP